MRDPARDRERPAASARELAQLRNELALLAPPSFDVELTNRCNLRCRFCPREALTRPRGAMTDATLAAVLEHTPLDGELFFCGLGEPLLHPGAVDAVRLAKRRGRGAVGLVTNGALLTAGVARRLRDAGLDVLQVSFNGITAEAYERVMVGGRLATARANLERALELFRGRPRVEVLFTDTRLNRGEGEAVAAFWRERGAADVRLTACHSRGGYLHDEALADPLPPPVLPVCGVFAHITFVAWTGEVLACCSDLPGKHVIGNLVDEDFEAIRERKGAVVRGQRWFPMCEACTSELRYSMLQLKPPGAGPGAEPGGSQTGGGA